MTAMTLTAMTMKGVLMVCREGYRSVYPPPLSYVALNHATPPTVMHPMFSPRPWWWWWWWWRWHSCRHPFSHPDINSRSQWKQSDSSSRRLRSAPPPFLTLPSTWFEPLLLFNFWSWWWWPWTPFDLIRTWCLLFLSSEALLWCFKILTNAEKDASQNTKIVRIHLTFAMLLFWHVWSQIGDILLGTNALVRIVSKSTWERIPQILKTPLEPECLQGGKGGEMS